MKTIIYAVWPTRTPDLCSVCWNQQAWNTFSENYRPMGYTGGIHDMRFYKEAIRAFERQDCDMLSECLGLDPAYDQAYREAATEE